MGLRHDRDFGEIVEMNLDRYVISIIRSQKTCVRRGAWGRGKGGGQREEQNLWEQAAGPWAMGEGTRV